MVNYFGTTVFDCICVFSLTAPESWKTPDVGEESSNNWNIGKEVSVLYWLFSRLIDL